MAEVARHTAGGGMGARDVQTDHRPSCRKTRNPPRQRLRYRDKARPQKAVSHNGESAPSYSRSTFQLRAPSTAVAGQHFVVDVRVPMDATCLTTSFSSTHVIAMITLAGQKDAGQHEKGGGGSCGIEGPVTRSLEGNSVGVARFANLAIREAGTYQLQVTLLTPSKLLSAPSFGEEGHGTLVVGVAQHTIQVVKH